MQHPGFFHRAGPFTIKYIASASDSENVNSELSTHLIEDVKPLHLAGLRDLTFFENRKYLPQLRSTQAAVCILDANDSKHAPKDTAVLTSKKPYQSFAKVLQLFYSDALRSKTAENPANRDGNLIHPSAQLAEGVLVEPGAIIGREAIIGEGTQIAAGAVIGYRVVVGRDCYIGPNCTITHSIIGDGVIVHAGARVGQDGFGFALGSQGHVKVPQIGRVLIGNDVEIGANSTIDRGSLSDTVIGEGTKIDNLVQIAHNVVIGKNCIIVAQSGIAGSAELGNCVIMGAHSGVVGHIKIGHGAQIAGAAHVKDDLEPKACVGGTPARPFREWAKEIAALRLLAKKSQKN